MSQILRITTFASGCVAIGQTAWICIHMRNNLHFDQWLRFFSLGIGVLAVVCGSIAHWSQPLTYRSWMVAVFTITAAIGAWRMRKPTPEQFAANGPEASRQAKSAEHSLREKKRSYSS